MSDADSRLLSEMFSIVKNMDSRLENFENRVSNLTTKVDKGFIKVNKRLDDQYEMIEQHFVELKETQTVVEIHKADKKIHAL